MDLLTLAIAGLAKGSLYALVALGLVLVYKTQDVINFAHGEVFMAGAFAGYISLRWVGLPYWAACLSAVLAVALLGAVIERVAIRRIAERPHMTLAMMTVGLSFTLKGAARIPFGSDVYTLPAIFDQAPIRIGGLAITPQSLVTIGVALVLMLVLFVFFAKSTIGKQMRATQQNIQGAELVGVNTKRIFLLTWTLAAMMGAAAGVLAAPTTLLYPDMGGNFLLKGFAAAVLGGLESIPGAAVGGFLVGVIELLIGGYISTAFQDVSAFFIIMIVLFVKPSGLFGVQTRSRV